MAEESNKPTRRTERIGKYEILGHIATGGMGVIYKARDVDLDRLVALKLLPADLATQGTTLIRFHREAKAAARLRHENIVAVFDVGESNGTHFIALEYIEGTDLQDYINRKCRLDPEEARQIMIQATRALVHAHEHGIVHRDIKPSNFLLMLKDQQLVVKLTDFGLAIRYENDAEFRITRDKTTVGTVDYMSPEQARDSRSADIRSDIYSLGCTFYHMLAGQAPFARGTLPERIVQHMQSPPPDMRRIIKGVPEYLLAIIHRMLAKKPADRYQTPADLLKDLENPDGVAVSPNRAPITGKLERGLARKRPIAPTQVIESKQLDKESEEAKQVKTVKTKRAAGESITEKTRPAGKPKPVEEPAPPTKDETIDDDTEYDEADEPEKPIEEEAPERPRKKADRGSPAWMAATAASVGVLAVVLILALAFGGKTPEPKKPPVKPPDLAVVDPIIDLPPVSNIDTSPSKMSAGDPTLPMMYLRTDTVHEASLRKEHYGPFTAWPAPPEKATLLRLTRLATPDSTTFRSLAEAFAKTKPNEFTIIEVNDNGPIFVPFLPAVSQRQILLRGGTGFRPLIVWDVPKNPADKKPVTTFCSVTQGKLILENLDFVMKWADDGPATWFNLPDTDFHARECTFSLAGKSKAGIALIAREAALPDQGTTHTWLKRCFVRGADLSLLRQQQASAAVLLEESLVVSYQHPLIQMRCREGDALALFCVRSTLVTGQVFLSARMHDGKPGSPQLDVKLLDSILSRDDVTAPQGDMIQLTDGANASSASLKWLAVNTVYAGWRRLLASDSKSIDGADEAEWRSYFPFSRKDRAIEDAWPKSPPSALEKRPAHTFFPGQAPVAFAALTSPVAVGCVIGWLPPVPDAWVERAFDSGPALTIPNLDNVMPKADVADDGLYHGTPPGQPLDLNTVDLGAFLSNQKLAPRVVMHLIGKGICHTSPLRINGVQHLVLYVDPSKDAFILDGDLKSAPLLKSDPLIDITGGHLELTGLRLRLGPVTAIPAIIQLHGSSLTMTRCWLRGPLTKEAVGFKNLIAADNANEIPTTLLLRDNVLAAGKTLIHLQDHVQLKARNNVFVSFGDGVHFDVNSPSVPMQHVLDHNTWAVRQAFFTLRTGPAFQAVGPVLLHANSNAFLHPFADDKDKSRDKSAFLRGGDIWAASGRWSWQGRYNVYDSRIPTYLARFEKTVGARQNLHDWQALWGQAGEQDAAPYEAGLVGKLIPRDTVLPLEPPTLPKHLRGDLNQAAPGADPAILKKKG